MKKKILIVEDESGFVNPISALLSSLGYEVLIAVNGKEGLEKARLNKVDLIILDVMMPKMDGYKVCRMLKFDQKYKNVPILLFTAKSEEEDRNLGEHCGADGYISKSEGPEALVAKVKKFIEKHEN